MNYSVLLSEMMDAILKRDVTKADALFHAKEGFMPEAQLAIYTEGYRLRLASVIKSVYPALYHALGSAACDRLAASYIEANPSRSFNIDLYPVGFAAYVAREQENDFAADIARFESALHEVYQAPESPAITPEWIATQTMEALASTSLLLRSAAQLHGFDYPVHTYLAQLRADGKPLIPARHATYLLIYRHNHQVERLELEAGEYALLHVLAEGIPLMNGLHDKRILPYTEDIQFEANLMRWFQRWAEQGVFKQPCMTP